MIESHCRCLMVYGLRTKPLVSFSWQSGMVLDSLTRIQNPLLTLESNGLSND